VRGFDFFLAELLFQPLALKVGRMAASPTSNLLPRVLGPWMATALVIGTVIGSGVFKKASSVSKPLAGVDYFLDFGPVVVAWVLVGVLALIGALVLAEVAVLLPKAGGNYVFLKESYGRWAGFLWGWVEFWIIRSGSIAALATIFTEQVHAILRQLRGGEGDVLSFWALQGMTVTVILVLALVNARGTRLGGGLQVVITTVKVASLVGLALLPFIVVALVNEPRARPTTEFLAPAWPADWSAFRWSAFGAALVSVFWAYHGWMNIAPVAEEVREPQRNIPPALFCGVGTVILLYVSVNVAYYLVLPREVIAGIKGRTVAGEFSLKLLGSAGLLLASTAVMISVFGSLNGNLLVGPRLLFAMGRDRLAPSGLAKLHPRYETPARAQLVLAGWAVLMVACVGLMTQYRLPVLDLGSLSLDVNLPPDKEPFDVITDFAMFGAISFETLAVSSIFVLRRRYPASRVQIPYRCPLFPLLPIIYVSIMAAILANMFTTKRSEALIGVGFILVGAAIYAAFLARRDRPVPR
jgi:amino acid transporter